MDVSQDGTDGISTQVGATETWAEIYPRLRQIEVQLFEHSILSPRTLVEQMGRTAIQNFFEHITDVHCMICGETEEEGGTILELNSINEGVKHMCDDCYRIQQNM